MVAKTLNLRGDEELEAALEDAFDLRFTDSEFASMVTVGAIHDVIRGRMPPQTGACETSMAFYRLRRGLRQTGMTGRIDPSTALPPRFARRTHAEFSAISEATGLRLPTPMAGALTVGCLLFGTAALAAFLAGLILQQPVFGWLAAAMLIVGLILAKLDPGRLPRGVATVGDLARRTSRSSFGILAEQGGRVNDDLTWSVLCEVISEATDVDPDAIGRGTLIHAPRKAVA